MTILEEYSSLIDEKFLVEVVEPYFTDIFRDLCLRCLSTKQPSADAQDKSKQANQAKILPNGKFVDKVAFFEYTCLPGIICDRFYNSFEQDPNGNISEKSFVKGMTRVFLSKTMNKLNLAFNMYDFDNDGKVSREDVRILMSYVPFKIRV